MPNQMCLREFALFAGMAWQSHVIQKKRTGLTLPLAGLLLRLRGQMSRGLFRSHDLGQGLGGGPLRRLRPHLGTVFQ